MCEQEKRHIVLFDYTHSEPWLFKVYQGTNRQGIGCAAEACSSHEAVLPDSLNAFKYS